MRLASAHLSISSSPFWTEGMITGSGGHHAQSEKVRRSFLFSEQPLVGVLDSGGLRRICGAPRPRPRPRPGAGTTRHRRHLHVLGEARSADLRLLLASQVPERVPWSVSCQRCTRRNRACCSRQSRQRETRVQICCFIAQLPLPRALADAQQSWQQLQAPCPTPGRNRGKTAEQDAAHCRLRARRWQPTGPLRTRGQSEE